MEHIGKAIVVFGDVVTMPEMAEAYASGAGKPLPGVPRFLARALLKANKHTKGM